MTTFTTLLPTMAESLVGLHAACFAAEEAWSARSFTTQLQDIASFGWAAHEGLALAAALVGRMLMDEAEILTACTHPDFRRSGLSRQLLARAAAEASSRGAHTLHLEVAEDNAAAIALYRAVGFGEVGRRPSYYPRAGGAVAAVLLAKGL